MKPAKNDPATARVLVVGDVMLDEYISGDARRVCPEAPVPVVETAERWSVPGGAANAAAKLMPPNIGPTAPHAPSASRIGGNNMGPSRTPVLRPVMMMPKALPPALAGPRITPGAAKRQVGVMPAPMPKTTSPARP